MRIEMDQYVDIKIMAVRYPEEIQMIRIFDHLKQ